MTGSRLQRVGHGIGTIAARIAGCSTESAPPERLAGNRIALGAYALGYVVPRWRLLLRVHRTDAALFAPVGPVRVLRRPLPPLVADAIAAVEIGAAAAFTLGIAHRVTGPLHAALLLWTLSYRNSWSMIFHTDNALVLHTLVAGSTRAADAWSVDALLRRRAGRAAPAPHWRYGHATHLLSAITTTIYWLSGVAKVEGPLGWRWATGESLRSQVEVDALRKEVLGARASRLGVALLGHRWLWSATAAPSLLLELGAPLALAHPVLGRLWAAGAFGMHWGIKAVMGITFRYQLSGLAYASFVPWEVLARRR